MCQLCALKSVAESGRWPKPLEPYISDLDPLIDTAHTEATKFSEQQTIASKAASRSMPYPSTTLESSRKALTSTIHTIATLIDVLDEERDRWWNDPKKKQQRRMWLETFQEAKLTNLQKVNNSTAERIESLRTKLGMYVKWGLGVQNGLEELVAREDSLERERANLVVQKK